MDKNYVLYSYKKEDGSFDYEKYAAIQEKGNIEKLDKTWVSEENIRFLSKIILEKMAPEFGLCHGTRRGKEQEWFMKYLEIEVLGTEISSTATQFPNTIQWDFHNTKPEWIEKIDFIYSNSFDHSYDPDKCINTWFNCLKSGGLCIIEHSDRHGIDAASELDPFGAEMNILPDLLKSWLKQKVKKIEVLEAPDKKKKNIKFIIITKG